MTVEMMLDLLDINSDSMAAQHDDLSLKLNILDTGEVFRVVRRDGILLVYKGKTDAKADCTMDLARLQFLALMGGQKEVLQKIKITGDETVPLRLVKYMNVFVANSFNIIEP